MLALFFAHAAVLLSIPRHTDAFLPATYKKTHRLHNDNPYRSSRALSKSTKLAAVAADEIKPGRLVEYSPSSSKGGGPPALGAIVEPEGKRNWKVIQSSGRIVSVHPRDIKHVVSGSSVSTPADVLSYQDAARDALEEDMEAGGANVASVWEMLLEDLEEAAEAEGEGEEAAAAAAARTIIDLSTLADLIVGDDSPRARYAARAVLEGGVESYCFKKYTKKGGGGDDGGVAYELRPADAVNVLRNKARAEAEVAAEWEALQERLESAAGSRGTTDPSRFILENETKEVQAALKDLERLGCLANLSTEDVQKEESSASFAGTGTEEDDDVARRASARGFLKALGRKATPEAARSLLVDIGVWDAHENLDVIRQRTRMEFSEELEESAEALMRSPPPDLDEASRLDLTHLPALAIDEASTTEIDDALSVEDLNDDVVDGERAALDEEDKGSVPRRRQRLWVHIADPTRYVGRGSPLDREARRRTSSLYLPTGMVPMFPASLATGPLCLSPGEVSCALSVGVVLDESGGIDRLHPRPPARSWWTLAYGTHTRTWT